MRIVALLAALFLLASPLVARAAVPTASCPDILLGDSLAVGMGPYARAAGFEVVARTGIGLSWLRAQNPRCARRVVVVIGTNDLRGIDPWSAEAYPARLAAIMGRWQVQQIVWATPGCFPRDDSLERGSEALDHALAREPLVRVGAGRGYMRVHSGRVARCSYLSGDGIHPTGAGYRAWWASLSQAIGPAPEEEQIREASLRPARAVHLTRSAASARSVRQAWSVRTARAVQPARSVRTFRPVQQARSARPANSIQQARPARPSRSVQQARSARPTHAVQQARSVQPSRAVQQARSARPARPVQQARAIRPSRAAPAARPHREVRQARPPAPPPPRLVAVTPSRRT